MKTLKVIGLFLTIPFILLAETSDKDEVKMDLDPKLMKYVDKTYMDFSKMGHGMIEKIISSSVDSCVLFEDRVIYCEYDDKREIKLQLRVRKEGISKQISVLFLEDDLFLVNKIESPTIDEKNNDLEMRNKELRTKLDNVYLLLKKQEKQIEKAMRYKEKVSSLKKEIAGYDEIIKKNVQLCEIEKSEILAVTKNKTYKPLKEYTDTTKQLIKIKEQEESIRELLKIIDKLKANSEKKEQNKQEESKGFFSF